MLKIGLPAVFFGVEPPGFLLYTITVVNPRVAMMAQKTTIIAAIL